MITLEQALRIAQQHTGITDLEHRENTSNIVLYQNWDFDQLWVFTLPSGPDLIIKSSDVIFISKQTGEVLYEGSANDEG